MITANIYSTSKYILRIDKKKIKPEISKLPLAESANNGSLY